MNNLINLLIMYPSELPANHFTSRPNCRSTKDSSALIKMLGWDSCFNWNYFLIREFYRYFLRYTSTSCLPPHTPTSFRDKYFDVKPSTLQSCTGKLYCLQTFLISTENMRFGKADFFQIQKYHINFASTPPKRTKQFIQ